MCCSVCSKLVRKRSGTTRHRSLFMLRYIKRSILHAFLGILHCAVGFGTAAYLNHFLSPACGYVFSAALAGLLALMAIKTIVEQVAILTHRRDLPSISQRFAGTLDPPDGDIGSVNMAVAALIGCWTESNTTQTATTISYLVSGKIGVLDIFGAAILFSACFSVLNYLACVLTRHHRRWLLPKTLRDALADGKVRLKERQIDIDRALDTFRLDLAGIIALAEERGRHGIRLTFEGGDGVRGNYVLDYFDMGWPDGTGLRECAHSKFVSRACELARSAGLTAEIVRRLDGSGYCLELSW
jgi:hypothetical protein